VVEEAERHFLNAEPSSVNVTLRSAYVFHCRRVIMKNELTLRGWRRRGGAASCPCPVLTTRAESHKDTLSYRRLREKDGNGAPPLVLWIF